MKKTWKNFFINVFRFIGALFALVRGIMILSMLVIGTVSAYLIYATYEETVNQYNETLIWKNTGYDVPLSDIEPALVSNIVDTDIVNAATAWENLNTYLKTLEENPISDVEEAKGILSEAVAWQEAYHLKSDDIDRLSLYLELEEAIPKAYETLNTEELEELSNRLYNLELEEHTTSGGQYMERLKEVSSDFEEAEALMSETVGSIGSVKNGIWTIPHTYTRTDLEDVLGQIESMQKFPALYDTAAVLSDIADVLNYNKNAREYFEYQTFAQSVAGLDRSSYAAVSSIYTYEQAVAFGCRVRAAQMPGYIIDPNSPVTGIYYEGERLDSNEYIRKGAPVTAEIRVSYIPVEEIPIEEGMENIE